MARKSRSKQRSKGAGTRSGSAGGKSQGGGRSSAGKGKSQGGSGKSSSKGKSSSSKGKSSNKGGSGGRNNPSSNRNTNAGRVAAKSPAPKATPKAAPKAKAPTPKQTPKKTLTPVQQRFKDREAKGLDGLTGMRKVTESERKEGKTQLTQYRAAQKEQVRNAAIARNAANVTGIPSGDKLPAGSFGISEEGKALAAQQRAEAAAREKQAEQKAAREKQAADAKLARQFDPRRLDATATLKTNPLTDNNYFNLGRNVRVPNEDTASFRKLFKDDLSQVTRTDKAFKEGATGVKGFRPLKAFTDPNMRATGPTPLVRQTVERFLPAGLRNISLGSQIFNQGREDSGLTRALNRVDNTNVGGLSIGFKSPESTDLGARASRFLSSTFDKVAGGLNIGGSAQASEGGVDSGDPTARVSGFKSVRPLGIAKEAVQGFGDVLTGQRTDFDKLGRLGFGATTDKLKDAAANMRINEVTDTLKKSPIRQAAVGFNYGIDVPDAIKQVDETRSVLNKTFKDFKGKDIDLGNIKPGSLDKNVRAEDLRGGISNTLYNLDRMPTLARGLSAFNTETDGGGDKEFRKDLRFTFNRKVDAPTGVPGRDLMKATTPGIVNRVLSGKLKDMGQEAITQNNLTGGMTADKFDTIASTLNKNLKTEGTIANTRKKELTALAKRFGPGGGQAPTPKSILKGVNPFRGSNRGGGSTPIRSTTPSFTPSGGGGGTPVGQVPQIPATGEVPQFQVPELPVQQGTDAGNLANIQSESYQNTFRNLMAINPNYSARFQMRRRRGGRRGSFKRSFSRRFFS